jgi:hypothetical protein
MTVNAGPSQILWSCKKLVAVHDCEEVLSEERVCGNPKKSLPTRIVRIASASRAGDVAKKRGEPRRIIARMAKHDVHRQEVVTFAFVVLADRVQQLLSSVGVRLWEPVPNEDDGIRVPERLTGQRPHFAEHRRNVPLHWPWGRDRHLRDRAIDSKGRSAIHDRYLGRKAAWQRPIDATVQLEQWAAARLSRLAHVVGMAWSNDGNKGTASQPMLLRKSVVSVTQQLNDAVVVERDNSIACAKRLLPATKRCPLLSLRICILKKAGAFGCDQVASASRKITLAKAAPSKGLHNQSKAQRVWVGCVFGREVDVLEELFCISPQDLAEVLLKEPHRFLAVQRVLGEEPALRPVAAVVIERSHDLGDVVVKQGPTGEAGEKISLRSSRKKVRQKWATECLAESRTQHPNDAVRGTSFAHREDSSRVRDKDKGIRGNEQWHPPRDRSSNSGGATVSRTASGTVAWRGNPPAGGRASPSSTIAEEAPT